MPRHLLLWPAALLCASLVQAQERVPQMTEIAGGSYAVPVRTLQQIKQAGTLIQQYDFSCGSAAVATLLTHQYGRPTTDARCSSTCTPMATRRRSAARASRCST